MRQTTMKFIALMILLCSSAILIAQQVKYNYDRDG